MRWTMPRPSRACCCVPLRRGLIAFVYLNLVLTLALHAAFVFIDYVTLILKAFSMSFGEYLSLSGRSKVNDVAVVLCVFGGAAAEIGMTVVALVGLHKKNIKLVRAYLYFTVVYTILIIVLRSLNIRVDMYFWEVAVPAMLLFIVLKVYYILLLRSQYKKMLDKVIEEKTQVELEHVNDNENNLSAAEETEHAGQDKNENFNDDQILMCEEGVEKIPKMLLL